MMSDIQIQSYVPPPPTFSLTDRTPTERTFLEYMYVQIYSPPQHDGDITQNLWNPSQPTLFSRSLIQSLSIKFGYTYVLAWLVRKHIGRRQLMRAVYDIPEILEIHKLWQNSEINITIKTKTGSLITINRKNNINQ